MFSEEFLRQFYNKRRPEIENADPEPEFDLTTIIGDAITKVNHIDTFRQNPRRITALSLRSGRVLLVGKEGRYDESRYHLLLLTGQQDGIIKDQYGEAGHLFNADRAAQREVR